jgi:hypothetical protein
MTDPVVQTAASEIRRNYDLCTEAILNGDPDGFVAAFGPAGRGETAEGVPIMMAAVRDYIAWGMVVVRAQRWGACCGSGIVE